MDFTTLIANLGFPIVCVIGLAWYVKYVTDKHEKEINNLRESFEKTNAELKNALDNNTRALTEIVIYLKEVLRNENNGTL